MDGSISRRDLLCHTLAGAALGVGSRAHAAASLMAPNRRAPDRRAPDRRAPDRQTDKRHVERLVRIFEQTPRDRVLESTADEVHKGANHLDVLAALLLAGVREVQPRPSVGFKFHTVLAVISYHLIGRHLAAGDRWLPLFWGIDYFKEAQASDVREGNWTLGPVDEAGMPKTAEASGKLLVDAMWRWDEPTADRAAAAVARTMKPEDAFERFIPLGARDFRSIGHKAIFVMGARRTLALIGWQFAEPVLRSLAYALLMHEGDNPADRDDLADRPWRRNEQVVAKIRDKLVSGPADPHVTTELLAILRRGTYEEVVDAVVDRLNHGASVTGIWDAIFCGAAELQLRLPNIVTLHAVTTTRAVFDAYTTTVSERTRRMLLLQNAALLTLFRDAAGQRGRLQDAAIDRLEPIAPKGSDEVAMDMAFQNWGGRRQQGVGKILGYLQAGRPSVPLVNRIGQTVAVKGSGAHDFKFTSAALESAMHVSKAWRSRYLAAGAMQFCDSEKSDNPIVQRARLALGAVSEQTDDSSR